MGPAEEADASRRSFNFVQGWVLGCLHSLGQDRVRILEQQAVSWRPAGARQPPLRSTVVVVGGGRESAALKP